MSARKCSGRLRGSEPHRGLPGDTPRAPREARGLPAMIDEFLTISPESLLAGSGSFRDGGNLKGIGTKEVL